MWFSIFFENAFHVAGRNMLRIWITQNSYFLRGLEFRWAVPRFRLAIPAAVHLDQLRVIDLISEHVNHRVQVDLVAITGELHAVRDSIRNVLNELRSTSSIALSN